MTPFERSRAELLKDIRKALEESNLPIEVATAIADLCEPRAEGVPQLLTRPNRQPLSPDEVQEVRDALPWIPVSERRPEPYETVLLNCDGELRSTGFWDGSGKRGNGWKVDADHPADGAAWVVTHWQPLPASPGVNKQP